MTGLGRVSGVPVKRAAGVKRLAVKKEQDGFLT